MGLKKFFIAFSLATIGGALTLRWLALDFLYANMPDFIPGIAGTLISSAALATSFSFVLYHWISKIEKVGKKVQKTGEVTEKDKKTVLVFFKTLKSLIVVENVCGFFIGQLVCMILDFKNGVLPYELSRAVIIMIQASLVGVIAGMYEVYYLDNKLGPYRKLLQIRSVRDMPGKSHTISSRILVTCIAALFFMGINCFTCGYSIIHGDNIASGANLMQEYLLRGIRCLILVAAECVGLILIVLKEMKNRLAATSELVTNLADTGDITKRIDVSMQDDIAVLISSLNFFLDKLEGIIMNLSTDSSAVSDTANILEESAAKSVESLKVVKEAVAFIDSEDKNNNESIKKAYTDIQSVKDDAERVEKHIRNQASAMNETSEAVAKMNESIENVANISLMANQISDKLKRTSEMGTEAIQTAVNAISEIQGASVQIQGIIKMIQKIASQTNLLSMNASIEAAHAGSFGAGFAVVADEVRSLANTSSKNAKTIKDYMNEMSQKIDNGVSAIQKAGLAFNQIDSDVDETVRIVEQIRQATELQKIGAADTLQSTQTVVEAINQIEEVAKQQRQHADAVYTVMLNVVNSSQEITNALEKTSESIECVSINLTDVEDCSRINKVSVESMNDHINLFKLRNQLDVTL
ncbi:MAG: methyl-accepting chemotaxis protein [Treponema sp.]|uniref:methyl-accepting chemotaxis protein n=1 Tax=Treponema sp. TaxID=166 RepID=UPI00298DEDF2|nr:methyl-accepting chemotaxis protein [Treponema sp.]MDD5810954.1 methyl-accepting chemotaxis protein [Treponema sp.]